jgi:hypothetical protein
MGRRRVIEFTSREHTFGTDEDGIPYVLTDKLTQAALADAFSFVERHNLMVHQVVAHPDVWREMDHNTLWGADVVLSAEVPTNEVHMVIDNPDGVGAVKAKIVLETSG